MQVHQEAPLRIYPLYLPALFLFVVLFHYGEIYHQMDFAPVPQNMVIHVLGLQGLASPLMPPLPTLWFIGVIVLYYFVYLIIALCGMTTCRILATSLILLGLFVALRHFAGVVDNRFFLYYPAFVAGILACRGKSWVPSGARWALMVGSAVVALGSGAALWPLKDQVYDANGLLAGRSFAGEAFRLVFLLSGTLSAFLLAGAVAPRLPQKARTVVLSLSLASYGVYLYHRIIFALLSSFVKHVLGVPEDVRTLVILVVGVPLAFIVAYALQRVESSIST